MSVEDTIEYANLVNENIELKIKLQKADEIAKAIDTLVERNVLDARSIVSDARLAYGNPFEYEFLDKT